MGSILTVRFADGDIVEQFHMLKVSALTNHDQPTLWRLTDELLEMLLTTGRTVHKDRWPSGYITENSLFGVPVDFVHTMPHLLCEDYVIYPYTVSPPRILLPH